RFSQISILAGLAAAGLILYGSSRQGNEHAGYLAIFSLAAAAPLGSLCFLLLHPQPPLPSPPPRPTFSLVRPTLGDRDHRLLTLYLSLLNFGVYLSAPFFSTYMLRPPAQSGLGWSYARYTAVTGIVLFFKFVFLPLWGRAADRFGARKCLTLSAW